MLPTGGISGNGYIFSQFVKRKVSALKAFTVLVLESVGYYIAFLFLLGAFFTWYYFYTPVINIVVRYTVILGYLFFGALMCVMFAISNKRTLEFVLRKLNRAGFVRRYLQRIHMNFKGYYTISLWQYIISKSMFTVVALQVCIVMADVFTVYSLLRGFQIHVAFPHTAFAVLLSMVIGSLPVSPGALIAYESAMTYFLTLMGSPLHAAIVVTLLYRFFSFWLPIPIGVMLYRKLS